MSLSIRAAAATDNDAIWEILAPIFRAGDTYAIERDVSREDALGYWCATGNDVFVVEEEEAVLGTYLLHPNQRGGGGHVCNCAFATASEARGRGVARAMLAHALETARAAGFRAMQFNFVVSTNDRAVAIWQANGFEIVGRLPGAFEHPDHGFVDSYVMYKQLD